MLLEASLTFPPAAAYANISGKKFMKMERDGLCNAVRISLSADFDTFLAESAGERASESKTETEAESAREARWR